MATVAEIKAKLRRPERTVPLCLAGDLQAQYEQLERDLTRAREKARSGTLAGGANAEATEIARRIQALQEEMREHTEIFTFRGLTRRQYSDLVAAHPPTEEQVEKNSEVDVNWDTFGVALITACCISHEMAEAEMGELVDELTAAQYGALFTAAQAVNVVGLDVPNSFTASAVLRASKKSSK
ncbi:hypothetical protein AB0L65_33115 [Nonomuraea sp. NPDC052116]|uniref:hypothetical protein n=1 Tax=Nonomuraea sp. NPDC052116 TaxID=3155665 RepID=UPI003412D108